jgi:hypothetical protein
MSGLAHLSGDGQRLHVEIMAESADAHPERG